MRCYAVTSDIDHVSRSSPTALTSLGAAQALERVEARGGKKGTGGKGDAEGDVDPWEREVSQAEVRHVQREREE